MKYLIFSLLFYSSYVRAQATEPVPLKDVKCAYGWMKCDEISEPVAGEDEKKVDYSKLDVAKIKADVINSFGGDHKEEMTKDFESRQAYFEAFCLSDVIGDPVDGTDGTQKSYINYLIRENVVLGVCSTKSAANKNLEKKSVVVQESKTASATTAATTASTTKAKTCGQQLSEVAKNVIGKNKAWRDAFIALDCKGPWPFHLGQLGAGIGDVQLVKDTMKTCGFKTLADWKYNGDKTRKVCGDYNKTVPAGTPNGAAITACYDRSDRLPDQQPKVEGGKIICYLNKVAKKPNEIRNLAIDCKMAEGKSIKQYKTHQGNMETYCEWVDYSNPNLILRQITGDGKGPGAFWSTPTTLPANRPAATLQKPVCAKGSFSCEE